MKYFYEIYQEAFFHSRHVMYCPDLRTAQNHCHILTDINRPSRPYQVRPVPADEIEAYITKEGEVKHL